MSQLMDSRQFVLCVAALLLAAVPACSQGDLVEPSWSDSEGRRLLSDGGWVWCTGNPEGLEDAARSLGLGTVSEDAGLDLTPIEVFRACSAAAAIGGLRSNHPGDTLLAAARVAGFIAPDDKVLASGLATCRKFDERGVTAITISVRVYETYSEVGPLPHHVFTDPEYLEADEVIQEMMRRTQGHIDQTTGAAEMVVGAASASVCPEYSEEVAAFG
jgi:hypothetical protein